MRQSSAHSVVEKSIPRQFNQDVQQFKTWTAWAQGSPSQNKTSEEVPTLVLDPRFPDTQWWETFNDKHLSGYIQEALDHNHTWAVARLSVEEARAQARKALGQELPQLNVSQFFTRQRNSANLTTPRARDFAGVGPRLFSPGDTVNIYQFPLDASYEIDFWLRNRDKTRALNKATQATAWDEKTVRIGLLSDVAQAYFKVQEADRLLRLEDQLIDSWKKEWSLRQALVQSGLVSERDILSIAQTVEQAQSQRQVYVRDKQQALNQLAVLLGRSPEAANGLEFTPLELCHDPERLTTGIPGELIFQRPDVLAEEARLEKAKIEINVARKAFLPTLKVSGQFGYASTEADQIFRWDSYLASLATSAVQSLFTGGQRRAELKVRHLQFKKQVEAYQQTVLNGLKEVENQALALQTFRAQQHDIAQQKAIAETAYGLDQKLLSQGLKSELETYGSQRTIWDAEKQWVQLKTQERIGWIGLYKALGGGVATAP